MFQSLLQRGGKIAPSCEALQCDASDRVPGAICIGSARLRRDRRPFISTPGFGPQQMKTEAKTNGSGCLEVLELYSTRGVHSAFLNGLVRNLLPLITRITADREALDWTIAHDVEKRQLHAPGRSIMRELYCSTAALRVLFPSRSFVLVTGAGPLVHLLISLVAPLKNLAIVVHSEFARASKGKSPSDRIIALALSIYARRRARLVVLSESTRAGIVESGLYPSECLKVLTHPLLPPDHPVGERSFEAAALHGLIRTQKLGAASRVLFRIRTAYGLRPVLFGQLDGVDPKLLESMFDHVELRGRRYAETERDEYFKEHGVGALLFLPGHEYRFTTSGAVCDATRLGCYVLGPSDSRQARELVGRLYNPDPASLNRISSARLNEMVHARALANLEQIKEIMER